ncbi:MAG: hypothetical protein A2V88_14000 [Elusimicrobia bacterium RBG_16_66_12]|nr:MAG: hypothetical protein A2V88_14000 [Elusimicrobia bacterium RBG_16_66_12]
MGPHDIELRIEDNLFYDHGQMAQAHTALNVITIERRSAESVMWDGVFHEVLEIIKRLYDLKLDHSELTVIACQMHQFWAQNLAGEAEVDRP